MLETILVVGIFATLLIIAHLIKLSADTSEILLQLIEELDEYIIELEERVEVLEERE